MGRAKQGYVFVRCQDCYEVVEVKYHRIRRWKMKCPKCGVLLDVKWKH